jgi:ABC-type transporter Mla subunit MlaD
MRRYLLFGVGTLEILVAGVLVYITLSLPNAREVGQGFERVEHTTRKASRQVGVMRRHAVDVRQPELHRFAAQLKDQTQSITSTIRKQNVDFDTIVQLRDSLRDVAVGLDGAAETLDPQKIGRLGDGLGSTADYLEKSLIPNGASAADQIDQLAANLSKDADSLAKLLRDAPPDLRFAKEIHDSLGRFDLGLEKMSQLLELKRIDAIREGFSGLESSLSTTAGQVDKLTGYRYPSVRIVGLKVEVEERPFWPNGDKIADGLRKATDGVRAAQKELDGLVTDLPHLRKAIEESRKVVGKTRDVLGQTLKQQDKLEPLLRDIPSRSAKIAEELPRLLKDLSRIMRETKQMREVAAALRQAQRGIDSAVARWPELRNSLKRTAELLRTSSEQLDRAVKHRSDYEKSLKQNTELADKFADSLPLFTQQLTTHLEEQERSLAELETSLDEVGDTIPAYRRNAVDVIGAGRLLGWLFAAMVGLHGAYVLQDGLRARTSPVF